MGTTEQLPEVAEAIRIADKYLPDAHPMLRAACAKEILTAIARQSEIVAMTIIGKVAAQLNGGSSDN